mmetsp:Transcript_64766/g.167181  ORF Transcript_64766/g.167181 Transcript_64766/m.167181 type:complete len:91 (-) Transcript_64766:34-306(-)
MHCAVLCDETSLAIIAARALSCGTALHNQFCLVTCIRRNAPCTQSKHQTIRPQPSKRDFPIRRMRLCYFSKDLAGFHSAMTAHACRHLQL